MLGAGVTTHYDLDIARKRHANHERVPYLSSILYLPPADGALSRQNKR